VDLQQASIVQTIGKIDIMKHKTNNMDCKYSWIKIGFIVFLLLFAFEPIVGFSNVYLNIMLFLAIIGFIVLISCIVFVFKGNIKITNILIKSRTTSIICPIISILGIIISYIYSSNLLKFWLFMLAINLIGAYLQFSNQKNK